MNESIIRTVLWRRNDLPGHEICRLTAGEGWKIAGAALFAFEDRPCWLEFEIECAGDWTTRAALVSGWVGDERIDVRIVRDSSGQWRLNETLCIQVSGCLDIDLNFSPSTNLLPIRRLELEVGATAPVKAAWLRFPSFELEPLAQFYTRVDRKLYRYESGGGSFVAPVTVDEFGLVVNYGELWSRQMNQD